MKTSPITKEKLSTLREGLPFGSQLVIAEKTGYSKFYVNRVMSGTYYNQKIIKEAIRMYKEAHVISTELEKVISNG